METLEVHGKKHKINNFLAGGCYTKAYELRSGRVLCVTKNDPAKEVLLAIQKYHNPHIPKLRLVSTEGNNRAYYMLKYKTIDEIAMAGDECPGSRLSETLREKYQNWWWYSVPNPNHTQTQRYLGFAEYLTTCDGIPSTLAEAVRLIISTAIELGYHEFFEDMHGGNLATTLDGETLILLDMFGA